LGIICGLVLIGTSYDLFKRFQKFFKTSVFTNSLIFTDLLKFNKNSSKTKEEISLDATTENESSLKKQETKKPSLITQLMLNFSFYNNTIKLFKVNETPGQLDCLNAIRVLSMGYVVLGHLFSYGLPYSDNQLEVFNTWLKYPSTQIITLATYSVDTFFLLS